MKTAIIWFTNNLRVNDNKPLLEAIAHADQVIPLYVFDPKNLEDTNFGTRKMGTFRLKFLMESLHSLNEELKELGSKLLFEISNPEKVISDLVDRYQVTDIYVVEPLAYEERILIEAVEKISWSKKCVVHCFETSTLFSMSELPFPLKKLPDVFTKFRTIIEKECQVKEPLPAPSNIYSPILKDFSIPIEIKSKIDLIQPDERSAFPFQGGVKTTHKRLQTYFFDTNFVAEYKETRNGMIGSDYSTKFSPWLALGCISPREIIDQLRHYETTKVKNESTYWVYFEMLWREYFHWVMRKYDRKLFLKNGIKENEPILRHTNLELFEKWKNGETTNEFVDANMRELNATGFMSNRGRQNVASFLCNDLQVDWRLGAAYFEEQLIDYDVCSNWGNWAYIAGVGNDPRGHRVFNVEKQANDYDKDYSYRNLWKK
jgi:deoxyribodipyrimidine photo-lyase